MPDDEGSTRMHGDRSHPNAHAHAHEAVWSMLDEAGLNRQHVFELAQLPAQLLAPLDVQAHERQLILLAHAGTRLWSRVQAQGRAGAHPIDTYSIEQAQRWLAHALPTARYRIVYPNGQPGGLPAGRHLGLQSLGQLAGWHHSSPFMLGIDARWGSWFAYRVAIIADTRLPPSPVTPSAHPCHSCTSQPCRSACPAHALDAGAMDTQACRTQRLQPGSACALDCPARLACPVGAEHRYETSQIRHGAAASLAALRHFANGV